MYRVTRHLTSGNAWLRPIFNTVRPFNEPALPASCFRSGDRGAGLRAPAGLRSCRRHSRAASGLPAEGLRGAGPVQLRRHGRCRPYDRPLRSRGAHPERRAGADQDATAVVAAGPGGRVVRTLAGATCFVRLKPRPWSDVCVRDIAMCRRSGLPSLVSGWVRAGGHSWAGSDARRTSICCVHIELPARPSHQVHRFDVQLMGVLDAMPSTDSNLDNDEDALEEDRNYRTTCMCSTRRTQARSTHRNQLLIFACTILLQRAGKRLIQRHPFTTSVKICS